MLTGLIVLNKHLEELKQEKGAQSFTELTAHMHFYPDLHGNRSPLADSKMHGSLSGITLATSLTSLALLFHLTLESLALQTRHILSALNEAGHTVMEIYVSGSQAKNAGLMAMIADCCGVPVVIPDTPSAAVVRGAAMLGRMADEMYTSSSKSESQSADNQAQKLWNIMVRASTNTM
jgi:ribulose kinase